MVKQRARLTDDNDPLSSTDSVFASLEQAGKSESQQAGNMAIQQVEKSKTKQVDNIAIQQVEKSKTKQVDNIAIQQVEKSKTKQQPIKQPQQLDNLPASQQVIKSTIRKSTFQLSEEILKQLDRYHLQLQIDLGKADAPYKEIIVEEAIAQFLAEADPKSVNSLIERQKTR